MKDLQSIFNLYFSSISLATLKWKKKVVKKLDLYLIYLDFELPKYICSLVVSKLFNEKCCLKFKQFNRTNKKKEIFPLYKQTGLNCPTLTKATRSRSRGRDRNRACRQTEAMLGTTDTQARINNVIQIGTC